MSNDGDMTMRSEVLVVSKIVKKTQARTFKEFEVGDRIRLSVESKRVGSSRGRSYAVDVRVDNLTSGKSVHKTFNQLGVLDNFEFTKEVD